MRRGRITSSFISGHSELIAAMQQVNKAKERPPITPPRTRKQSANAKHRLTTVIDLETVRRQPREHAVMCRNLDMEFFIT